MTLCIAWRDQDDHINFASDSRVTVATNSYEDVAIKITRIPCEIFPQSSSLTPGTGIIRIPLGMAFAGSHICAYVIKESLVEVLSRLQHVSGATEISMDQICKIAFYAYEKLSKKVCSTSIGKNGTCELFIAGFCPKEQRERAFKFSTNLVDNSHSMAEILKSETNEIELSGSGKDAKSLKKNIDSDPLKALKDVIDDQGRDDVGGSFQYGIFSEDDFKIFCEYTFDKYGWPAYMRGGLNVHDLMGNADQSDLFISPLPYDIRYR